MKASRAGWLPRAGVKTPSGPQPGAAGVAQRVALTIDTVATGGDFISFTISVAAGAVLAYPQQLAGSTTARSTTV